MNTDKRTGQPPVPENLEDWLNNTQLQILRKIEEMGFKLIFMRRPLLEDPVPIVINNQGNQIGVLEKDGRVNTEVHIELRRENDAM
jgi:hypothetical protein